MADTLAHPASGRGDNDDATLLHTALAVELAPYTAIADDAEPSAPSGNGLRDRLLERVHRSALALRDFVTVRRDDTPWTGWSAGVRTRHLHDNGPLCTLMLELAPGAALPQPEDAAAQEILVLRGKLTGPAALGPQSFCLRTCGVPGAWTAPQGALLYLRELRGPREALPEAEAHWWPAADAGPVIVPADGDGWLPFSPGVQVKPLAGGEAAISMLARFQPGARVATHGHGLDEDCVMLEGDLYLGDLLLREGEYQLAPAGTVHDGLMSDHGSVLYFHGAIDAALRGEV